MNGPPTIVITLPTNASLGFMERSEGLAKIARTPISLVDIKEGLLNATCTVQFPAVATSALTATIEVEFKIVHAEPGIPQTETEQF